MEVRNGWTGKLEDREAPPIKPESAITDDCVACGIWNDDEGGFGHVYYDTKTREHFRENVNARFRFQQRRK